MDFQYLPTLKTTDSLNTIQEQIPLDELHLVPIDCINWPEYGYCPYCSFTIAHLNDGLFLYFKVIESDVRAEVKVDNGPVYTDSCVELFIDPAGDGSYYNFEFNSYGILLEGFGNSRVNRQHASEQILDSVKRFPMEKKNLASSGTDNLWEWSLIVLIPFTAFFRHNIISIAEKEVKANLYKCGNLTEQPHYLSWNKIKTPAPDFHRPEFFGNLVFKGRF
jgi:hypothetical protein